MRGAERKGRGSVRELALLGGTVATARVFDVAISYVFYIVLSRAVGVREFGALVLATTVTQTAAVFARFGLDGASLRGSAEAAARGEIGVGRMLLIGCAVAAALSIIGMGVLLLFYREAFAGVNGFVLFALPVVAIAPVFAATLRGFGRVRLAALGESILQPLLALLMVIVTFRTGSVGWASASLLMSTLGVLLYCAIFLQRQGAFHAGSVSPPALVRLGGALVAAVGFNSLGSTLDIMILGRVGAIAQVALYAAALKIGRALLLVADANTLAVGPSIPRLLREGDLAYLGLMYRTSTRWIVLITAPGALILLSAPEFVLRFFGPQFAAAAPILRIHVIAFAVFAFAGPAKVYLLMSGHEHFMTKNAALNVATTAVLMIALIPHYGGIGAAVALLVATVIQRMLLLVKVESAIRIRIVDARNAMLFLGFAFAVAASLLAPHIGSLPAALVAIVLVLTGAMAGGFDEADRDVISGIFQRRRAA
jgi:O-antigen/teichoic acid export membrane protein